MKPLNWIPAVALLTLGFVSGTPPVSAQTFDRRGGAGDADLRSLRVHATIETGGQTLETAVLKRKPDLIRAMVRPRSANNGELTYIYNGEALARVPGPAKPEANPDSVEGDKAATVLFDLIGLNPLFHFREDSGRVVEKKRLLGDYRMRLHFRQRNSVRTNQRKPRERPDKLELFRVGPEDPKLLRSIKYRAFENSAEENEEPSEMEFRDHIDSTTGRIRVKSVEYNAGVPAFLFKHPGSSGSY